MAFSKPPPPDHPLTLRSSSLIIFCSVIWGGTVVAIQYSVDSLPPVGTAGIRFALASLFMLLWCLWDRRPIRLLPGEHIPVAISGGILFAQIALFNIGTLWTSSTHSALMINIYPVFVAVFAHYLLVNDRLTLRKCAGLATAFGGVVIVVVLAGDHEGARDPSTLRGDVTVLVSSFLLAIKTIYMKRVMRVIEPNKLLLWQFLIAVALFALTSLMFEGIDAYTFTAPAVAGLLYQGIAVAGFCFACWAWLLKRHPASQLTAFTFVTPLAGMVIGNVFRGDALSMGLLLGGVLVTGGIYLVTTSGSRAV